MANTPFNGNQYILYTRTGTPVSPSTVPTWEAIVCLTSNGFSPEDNQIDAGSKCTGDWNITIPGRKGWSITGEAQAISTPDVTMASHKKLLALWKAGTSFEAMIAGREDDTQVEVRGDVRVTDISITYPDNDLATFSLTLTGQGEPFFEPES